MDTAAIVQTPIHPPAVFALQHDSDAEIAARGSPKMDDPALLPMLPPQPVQNAVRGDNSSQERGAAPGKDKDPPFDFQKFLDQMKTKGAEPVARYLRS
jgi:hypothetical protein